MIRFRQSVLATLLLALSAAALAAGDAADAVNINTADADTMARVLQGVGQSRAQAIVQYRDQHGKFVDAYELTNVKGIGEHTVEMNEKRIVLDD